MLYLTGIIATDEVNRYNERISLSALVNAYVRQWADIMPYTYNHDSTKLIGCSKLWGVYIQPRKAMITNTACIAEDSNDRNAVTRLLSGTFARNIPPEYAQLQEQLSNVIIGEYSPVLRGSVAIRNIGIVARTFPELLSQCDPDGLIDPVCFGCNEPFDLRLTHSLWCTDDYSAALDLNGDRAPSGANELKVFHHTHTFIIGYSQF